ncbi:MAG TPA: ankyrin repeat domain-containing protein [Pyrinomonadaceae bacterium]|nr:ankyrin repeat domain-containing protein [Pyrinomonadaceae bacterium]
MSALLKEHDSKDAMNDLWLALETGDESKLDQIMTRVPDIDSRNQDGVTALMRAAQKGHSKMVKALILSGADVNATRGDGFTPLLLAVFFGHADVVKVLVEYGADVNAVTRSGTSAEAWARARSFNDIAHYLATNRQRLGRSTAQPSVDAPTRNVISVEDKGPPQKSSERLGAAAATPRVSRTLSEPPDIWELVPEARVQFKPGEAFVTHLMSGKAKLLLITFALIGSATIGWALLADKVIPYTAAGNAETSREAVPPSQSITTATDPIKTTTSVHEPVSTDTSSQVTTEQPQFSRNTVLVPHSKKSSSIRPRRDVPTRNRVTTDPEIVEPHDAGKPETAATSQPRRIEVGNTTTRKSPSSISSTQLIAPAASPRKKPKVIQWP